MPRSEPAVETKEYQQLFEVEDRLWWFVGMREATLALIERFVENPRGLCILDAGCGTGGMLPHLASYGSVVGTDLYDEALSFSSHRRQGHLVQSTLPGLPFPSGSFDLVTSLDVIYHQAVPDDEVALSEMARVLRPGGTLLLRVPAHDRLRSRHDIAVHTRHRYGKRELVDKLERAGLKPVYVSYLNCFLFPFALVKRLVEPRLPQHDRGSALKEVPPVFNRLLTGVLRLEAGIVRSGRLPFGLSLVAVARRNN
jgi:SAM-dependent methyltransferase